MRKEKQGVVPIKNKLILDATCGGRTIWFQKEHPAALYIDIRELEKGEHDHRPNFCVSPDMIADFRDLPFADKSFKLIVWDPPHLKGLQETSHMAVKYGCLNAETWQEDLRQGFAELWRVLDDHGVLIFKWNERQIPLKQIFKLFGQEPLFGHTTGSKSQTHWCTFMKGVDQQ